MSRAVTCRAASRTLYDRNRLAGTFNLHQITNQSTAPSLRPAQFIHFTFRARSRAHDAHANARATKIEQNHLPRTRFFHQTTTTSQHNSPACRSPPRDSKRSASNGAKTTPSASSLARSKLLREPSTSNAGNAPFRAKTRLSGRAASSSSKSSFLTNTPPNRPNANSPHLSSTPTSTLPAQSASASSTKKKAGNPPSPSKRSS